VIFTTKDPRHEIRPARTTAGLITRARDLVCAPRAAWPRIAVERASLWRLFTRYVAVLAALPLCAELARLLILRVPLDAALEITLPGYVLQFALVGVLALVATKLAPLWGGIDDFAQCVRLTAYGYTPAWLAGIFLPVPAVGSFVALAGSLYAIYVFSLGTGALACIPPRRRAVFTLVVVGAVLALAVAVEIGFGFLTGGFAVVGVPAHPLSANPG
jgi:hypothetical protein